jgi:hypothetical protein
MKVDAEDVPSVTSELTPTNQNLISSESSEIRPRIVLTNEQARDIFKLKSGHGCASLHSASIRLASKYGVSSKAIRDIWKGRSWLEATFDLWNIEDRPAKRIIGRPKGKKDSKPRMRGSSTKSFGEKESTRPSTEYSHEEYAYSGVCQGHELKRQGTEPHSSLFLQMQNNSYPHYPSSFNFVGNHEPGVFPGTVCHPSPYTLLPSIGRFPQNYTLMPAPFEAPLHAQLQPISMMRGPRNFGAGGFPPPMGSPLMPASGNLSLLGIELLTHRLLEIAADNLAHPSLPATRPAMCY